MKSLLLIAGVLSLGATAHADRIRNDGMVIRDDGTIRLLTRAEAMEACPPGWHLPSARELAVWAQSQGSKIIEASEVDPSHVPANYNKISALNVDGSTDTFYFIFDNFKNPYADLKYNTFRTSSLDQDDHSLAYILDLDTGLLFPFDVIDSMFEPVRCERGW